MTQATDTSASASREFDSGASRTGRADMLRLLLQALLVFTPMFYWVVRSHVPELDRITVAAACISCEVGFAIALALIVIPRQEDMSATAAGLAAGIAGGFAIGAILWSLLELVLGHNGPPEVRFVLGTELLLCGATMIVGLRHARSRWSAFGGGFVCAVFVHVGVGSFATGILSQRQKGVEQARTNDRSRESVATQLVYALTGCALTSQSRSADHAFPSALSGVGTGPDCAGAPATATSLAGYTLSYTPRLGGNGQQAVDFQIVATPLPAERMLGAVVSDGRGIVFVIRDLPESAQRSDTGAFVVNRARGLSFVTGYRNIINEYIEKTSDAPDSLTQVAINDPDRAGLYFAAMDRDTSYRVTYVPPRSHPSKMFAVAVTCAKFGGSCIRSYYLAHDGRTHATGEPRAATEADPLAPDDENSDGAVRGIVGWGGR